MFYSKEEILEGYLNTVYYGHGAYGIEAASHYFFNKEASDLTIAEALMLAGIPKGPTYYSPQNDLERATNRQQQILAIMQQKDIISEEEYFSAKSEQLVFTDPSERKQLSIGPYFQDTVLTEATELLDIDQESVRSGGYQIYTTLDINLQKQLEESIVQTIQDSSKIEVGGVVVDPHNGAIRALVGGRSYEKAHLTVRYKPSGCQVLHLSRSYIMQP